MASTGPSACSSGPAWVGYYFGTNVDRAAALQRSFAELVGRSILQEIHRAHVEQARLMLIDTDLPMRAVARHSGFSHKVYLRRVVQRLIGIASGEIRRRARLRAR